MLSQWGEFGGPFAQERAEQRRAQQRQIAGAEGVAPQFSVFQSGDVAAILVGAFRAPVSVATGQPLARGTVSGS